MRNTTQLFLVIIILILALNGCGPNPSPTDTQVVPLTASSIPSTPVHATPTPTLMPIPKVETIVVTSAADSRPGTLRQALLDAENGDTIIFDATVFPPTNPTTIYVASELPLISQGNPTIDASNAGVILNVVS